MGWEAPNSGQNDLTHVLTHTGLSHNGLGRFYWIYDLRVFRKKAGKTLETPRKIRLFAAHNPEVVGSSPASATIKSTENDLFSVLFLCFLHQKVRSFKMLILAVALWNSTLTIALPKTRAKPIQTPKTPSCICSFWDKKVMREFL